MNTELRIDAKNDFEKDFFKLINNAVFGKTMGNVRKHRDIKLITTDKRRNQLASEPNYHTTKYFSENLLAIKMKKTKLKINKPVYLGMSILDVTKTLMYEFWYDYVKTKYQDKAQLCYMGTGSFIIHIKLKNFTNILQVLLKNGFAHQTTVKMIKNYFQQVRTRKKLIVLKMN